MQIGKDEMSSVPGQLLSVSYFYPWAAGDYAHPLCIAARRVTGHLMRDAAASDVCAPHWKLRTTCCKPRENGRGTSERQSERSACVRGLGLMPAHSKRPRAHHVKPGLRESISGSGYRWALIGGLLSGCPRVLV